MTGSGTQQDPYIIEDVNDLQAVENDLTAYYELGQDIDASATQTWNWDGTKYLGFAPIGDWATRFKGNFDGKGFKITGLFINRPTEQCVGLFGFADSSLDWGNLALQNVTLKDINITGGDHYVGGLVGATDCSPRIINCHVTGSLTVASGGSRFHGGLAGLCDGYVADCSFFGTITVTDTTGDRYWTLGGLIGEHRGDGDFGFIITRCHSEGSIICSGVAGSQFDNIGGLVGIDGGFAPPTIQQCYSTMNITINAPGAAAIFCIAGFVGGDSTTSGISDCYARGDVTIEGDPDNIHYIAGFIAFNNGRTARCYSTGLITTNGGTLIGGFCGKLSLVSITDSFWDTETSGTATSDGGTGKTTAEMKTKSTFTDAGWDFTTIWDIDGITNDGYPFLDYRPPVGYPYVQAIIIG